MTDAGGAFSFLFPPQTAGKRKFPVNFPAYSYWAMAEPVTLCHSEIEGCANRPSTNVDAWLFGNLRSTTFRGRVVAENGRPMELARSQLNLQETGEANDNSDIDRR